MKRIISIVMALMMLLSTLTVAVSAQNNSHKTNVATNATAQADFYNVNSKSYPLYINDGKIASTFGTAWDSLVHGRQSYLSIGCNTYMGSVL